VTDVIKANNIATDFYHSMLLGVPEALGYLQTRGLHLSTIEKFKLGYASDSNLIGNLLKAKGLPFSHLVKKDNDSEDYFKERIVIPFLDGDNTIFFTSRSIYDIGTKHLHARGGIPVLYNTNTLLDAKYICIVESPLDAITLEQHGVRAVAKLGTGLNLLENLLTPQIFLIPDIEESRVGEMDAIKTAAYLYSIGNIDVRIVYLPSNGVKVDPNLWFMDHTIEEFRKLLMVQARDVEPIIFPGIHGPETFTFEQAESKGTW
jgi:DNA primase